MNLKEKKTSQIIIGSLISVTWIALTGVCILLGVIYTIKAPFMMKNECMVSNSWMSFGLGIVLLIISGTSIMIMWALNEQIKEKKKEKKEIDQFN